MILSLFLPLSLTRQKSLHFPVLVSLKTHFASSFFATPQRPSASELKGHPFVKHCTLDQGHDQGHLVEDEAQDAFPDDDG